MREQLPFGLDDVKRWNGMYPTPFYVYDAEGIRSCVRELYDAFSWNEGFKEYFAVKATPTPGILRLLASLGCGADCASIPELLLAECSGISGSSIILSSNETLPEEYRAAAKLGAIINLDDITQIEHMEAACGIPETVCCRYNPGQFSNTNGIMGHQYDSKFGMKPDQLLEAYAELRNKGVKHFGLHAMLSSCSLDENYYPNLARELFTLVLRIHKVLGIDIEFVDFSGGIGIPYRPEEKAIDMMKIGAAVHKVYDELLTANGLSVRIYTEMGRYITGPYGYLVTRVVGKKHIYKEYVGVDATACNLMRPAMYEAYHHIRVLGKETEPAEITVDVVGSLCENNDKFAVNRGLPLTDIGDYLVIEDAGAHGHSMGYNYNGKLRSAELLMETDGSVSCIRRAQTPEDYFSTLDVDTAFTAAKAESII
ncbi:MAG: diaminopimelate decarboxylase [Lachnospiraceae bacterium]|nr:diaminopimelate decarboxylase [Lachnospiraceae bacterium]